VLLKGAGPRAARLRTSAARHRATTASNSALSSFVVGRQLEHHRGDGAAALVVRFLEPFGDDVAQRTDPTKDYQPML
jgi:hypothetical protein